MKRGRKVKTQKERRLLKNAKENKKLLKLTSVFHVEWEWECEVKEQQRESPLLPVLFAPVSWVRQNAFQLRKGGRTTGRRTGRPRYGKRSPESTVQIFRSRHLCPVPTET